MYQAAIFLVSLLALTSLSGCATRPAAIAAPETIIDEEIDATKLIAIRKGLVGSWISLTSMGETEPPWEDASRFDSEYIEVTQGVGIERVRQRTVWSFYEDGRFEESTHDELEGAMIGDPVSDMVRSRYPLQPSDTFGVEMLMVSSGTWRLEGDGGEVRLVVEVARNDVQVGPLRINDMYALHVLDGMIVSDVEDLPQQRVNLSALLRENHANLVKALQERMEEGEEVYETPLENVEQGSFMIPSEMGMDRFTRLSEVPISEPRLEQVPPAASVATLRGEWLQVDEPVPTKSFIPPGEEMGLFHQRLMYVFDSEEVRVESVIWTESLLDEDKAKQLGAGPGSIIRLEMKVATLFALRILPDAAFGLIEFELKGVKAEVVDGLINGESMRDVVEGKISTPRAWHRYAPQMLATFQKTFEDGVKAKTSGLMIVPYIPLSEDEMVLHHAGFPVKYWRANASE